jgi:hypothetical protein
VRDCDLEDEGAEVGSRVRFIPNHGLGYTFYGVFLRLG